MRLFHFSEEPDIDVFVPRPPLARPAVEPLVWTVAEWHAPQYYVPRDCPRVVFWAGADSTPEAVTRFLGGAQRVLAIEPGWLERVQSATLYRYEFVPDSFTRVDDIAGYWVSRETLRPLHVDRLDGLPRRLAAEGVELRLVEPLWAYHLQVVASSLLFSGNRLSNARDYDPALNP